MIFDMEEIDMKQIVIASYYGMSITTTSFTVPIILMTSSFPSLDYKPRNRILNFYIQGFRWEDCYSNAIALDT